MSFSKTSKFSATLPKLNTYFLCHHSFHSKATKTQIISYLGVHLSLTTKPGTFTCKRTRCKTCPFISNTVTISGPNQSAKVTDHFTCFSVNVICSIYNLHTMQESTQAKQGEDWRTAFANTYETQKKKNNTDAFKPVAREFNPTNHSHHEMTISGLCLHHGNTESRKNFEQKFIF